MATWNCKLTGGKWLLPLCVAQLLSLTACQKKTDKEVLRGMIEIGDTAMDYQEYNGFTDQTIDDINQKAAEETAEESGVTAPIINNISQEDLDSARKRLQQAGQEARAYGESRVQQ